MKQRLAAAIRLPCYLLAPAWLALVAAWALLLGLRALNHSELEHSAFEHSLFASVWPANFDWLQPLRPYYAVVFWSAAGVALAVLALLIACWTREIVERRSPASESAHRARRQAAGTAWVTLVICLALSGMLLGTSRYFEDSAGSGVKTLPLGMYDGASVALLLLVGSLLGRLLALR